VHAGYWMMDIGCIPGTGRLVLEIGYNHLFRFGCFIFGGRHTREFPTCEGTSLAKRHLAGHEQIYKFGETTMHKYTPLQNVLETHPLIFTNSYLAVAWLRSAAYAESYFWPFYIWPEAMFENALRSQKPNIQN
jgi:hypothetical protein